MRAYLCGALLVFAIPFGVASSALAEQQPLWELGIGVGAVSFPDYRGSDRQRTHAVPVPYLVYRGDFLKADRDGIRGVFFDSDRVELNLSLGASVPVDSDGNEARRGMPDLRPTVEFGPSLEVNLWRSASRQAQVDVRLPVRAAFAVQGGISHVGVVFSPTLNVDLKDPFDRSGWNLGMLAGPIFADARQHRYFYAVDERHALAQRPAYRAGGGYGGSQFIVALSKRYPRHWVGAFARYDSLAGAVFADSPLVRKESAWAAGVGVAWVLGQSAQMVAVDD